VAIRITNPDSDLYRDTGKMCHLAEVCIVPVLLDFYFFIFLIFSVWIGSSCVK